MEQAKDRVQLADMLKELPALYQQAHDLFTHDRTEMLKLGLMTKKEQIILDGAEGVESQAYSAKRKGEDAIPRPDYDSALPKEFVELQQRKRKIEPAIKRCDAVNTVLGNLHYHRSYSPQTVAGDLGLTDLIAKVWDKYRSADYPLYNEYRQLETSIERKQRVGSRVMRIRNELYGQYEDKRKEAGIAASQAVLDRHKELMANATTIKHRIQSRRLAKLKPIREKMRALLEGFLKGG